MNTFKTRLPARILIFTLAISVPGFAQGFRTVTGKTYGVGSKEWVQLKGDYLQKSSSVVLVQQYKTRYQVVRSGSAMESAGLGVPSIPNYRTYQEPDKIIAITNAPDYEKFANGSKVMEWAMRTGTANINGESYELWDCGTRYTPPPLTQEQIKAKEKAENAKREAAEKSKKEADLNILKWNQQQADAGDAYGQLRMAERYRDGIGVETNLAKARTYFSLSAGQGNITAKQALEALSKP
jgi:hypothetical protein